jgi:hypothetical protein
MLELVYTVDATSVVLALIRKGKKELDFMKLLISH